jgi:hypothetical protein
MTRLAEIARQAWLECPLDGDHWEAAASAVRKAVLERAIERLSQKKHEYEINEKTAPSNQDALQWSGAALALDEALMVLQVLWGTNETD